MTLEHEMDVQRRLMKAEAEKFRIAYGIGGIGAVLLLVGWVNYGDGPLGALAIFGVFGLLIGVTGYFSTKRAVEFHERKLDELRAVQRDRKERGQY